MCGIVGIAGRAVESVAVLAALHHRGPDSHGEQNFVIKSVPVWIAHTRLSILDLSPAGHQPMSSDDGRWSISYNGELYNHLELRKRLPGPFRGHSDTETLVGLLSHLGLEKTLPLLNGMFAFAALDRLEGKIYLVRDPFGIKPLYYVHRDGVFAFSSEVRGLRAMGVVASGVDEQALDAFLTLRYVPSPKTLWNGVERLPPGHVSCFNLSLNQMTRWCYIRPVTHRFSGNIQDAAVEYRSVLRQAVRRQLASDVPVGVLLSGGIDSALVAAMARDEGQKLSCFTVGFGKGHADCEIGDAAQTAHLLELPFSAVEISPDDIQNAFSQISSAIEEPLGTTSTLAMWYLVQRARKDVTVVLTGQGSDEPWGGYRRYQVELLGSLFPWPPFWRMMNRWLGKHWPAMPEILERGLRTLKEELPVRKIEEACSLFPVEQRLDLTGRASDGGARQSIQYWLDWLEEGGCSLTELMMRLDTRMNLADDLLLYGDKISMAVSLEARVPMLDLEVVQFVESLPLPFRVALHKTKIVHRLMAQNYLPASIIHRKKKGFNVPFGSWSRGPWKEWIESLLLDSHAFYPGRLQRNGVERLWRQHLARQPDRSRQIFSLVMLSLWWRQQQMV
ncbi:MAG: asparagine synthase (glutamine-hydrolyzing) [Magnetococcales bacterium]|nr:asparagine synthase (glutamine-hydrolyzing) [Magnetococcales bacterium]MBF0149692.1 asparagine synthase (glutamine-hydrolyzing) [Magnetococcales bacterium]MBF0630742.1 asparagine synthase (glutamine-hydrolyzing) [Magnetococcales bacterium]